MLSKLKILQTDLQNIVNWAKANKISFNEEKSKLMFISKKRFSRIQSLKVYRNYQPIDQVQYLKYLGVYIDSTLIFDKHVSYISDKST